ncbi:hypothetical protein AB1Y20_007106 [Prymnesium parvum]|uniref:DUF6816 domain-containing protein n=1 Tax=Prymnesium parvum TaxID=97485 RepID=A0AB34IZH8_PRYPA
MQLLTRRVATLLSCACSTIPHAQVLAGGLEDVRRAASVLPGYGPADIAYPPPFRGRWAVTRVVVDVQTPLGEAAAPQEALRAARASVGDASVFMQRFVQDGASVIADRAFNAEHRAAATQGAPLRDFEARWEPSNPNVLTLARRSDASLVEYKVTKRSFEQPFDGAFGTSEYSRIADAGSYGVVSEVPTILAERVQVKYKWEPAADVRHLDALEITQTFDPMQTGFADLRGATPVLTIKARLSLDRSP